MVLSGEVRAQSNASFAALPPEGAGTPGRTRFIIELAKSVKFQVYSLPRPNRVVVELPKVKLRLPPRPRRGQPVGLVRSFRSGVAAPGKLKVVINVTGPVIIERSVLTRRNGRRELTIDIAPAAAAIRHYARARAAAAKRRRKFARARVGNLGVYPSVQPPAPRRAVPPRVRRKQSYRPVIVIDPGHGGRDSGAVKNGTVEKKVVLAFSLMLRDKLNATGRYRVLLTRDKDVFIPLGSRVAFAERNKANLFIAVHADYAGVSRARGATIYSLRPRTANRLRRAVRRSEYSNELSKNESIAVANAAGSVSLVRKILGDLARREVEATNHRTRVFSKSVINFMGKSTKMMRSPDRRAGFRVLRTAKVPSVLIELAFVTNRRDAANLRSTTWRDKVSRSIARAIDNYFSTPIARLPL
ncbi:MAG: N-acetylmuramoyl-L-alanine amidase [Pseudomonadota bacterium]